ncbi:MAG: hypothetical protein AB7V55_01925 [Oscillospiraceae bacterium]
MFDIRVYENREWVGLLQDTASVQWQEFYAKPGEVKIVAAATEQNRALLRKGNRLYSSDFDTIARIEQVEWSESRAKSTLTVRACATAALLDERVVMAVVNVLNVEQAMYAVYGMNRRGLPIASFSPIGYGEEVETQLCWGSVLDGLKTLAEVSGLGFKVFFDASLGEEYLYVYKGVDRRAGQPGYGGCLQLDGGGEHSVVTSSANCKNVAVVEGGSDGKVVTVSPIGVAGEARRELYVDAKHLQKQYRVAHNTGNEDVYGNPIYTYTTQTYPDADYTAQLYNAGLKALLEQTEVFEIESRAAGQLMQYGVDYGLGDIVPVRVPAYEGSVDMRVEAVKRVYETSGERTILGLRAVDG